MVEDASNPKEIVQMKGASIMLTDLQKRKLTVQFHQNDINKSGYIERADFEQFAKRICIALGIPEGSPSYEQVHTQTLAAWDNDQL